MITSIKWLPLFLGLLLFTKVSYADSVEADMIIEKRLKKFGTKLVN